MYVCVLMCVCVDVRVCGCVREPSREHSGQNARFVDVKLEVVCRLNLTSHLKPSSCGVRSCL